MAGVAGVGAAEPDASSFAVEVSETVLSGVFGGDAYGSGGMRGSRMSDRLKEALEQYDETDSVAIIRDLHNPPYVDVLAAAARRWADLTSPETIDRMVLALHCKRSGFDPTNERIQLEAKHCEECAEEVEAVLRSVAGETTDVS